MERQRGCQELRHPGPSTAARVEEVAINHKSMRPPPPFPRPLIKFGWVSSHCTSVAGELGPDNVRLFCFTYIVHHVLVVFAVGRVARRWRWAPPQVPDAPVPPVKPQPDPEASEKRAGLCPTVRTKLACDV